MNSVKKEQDFFLHGTSIIDEGASVGSGSKIWHFSHIMSDAQIGRDCILGQNVFIASGVNLGNGVKVQNNVSIYDGVICEDDVFIGPSAVFTNVINPRSFIERKDQYKKTLIKKGATIGANATIVCGYTIGKYALIGAGSVVVSDVKDYALIVGNPGKQIGWVSRIGHRLLFNQDNIAYCVDENKNYRLENNRVSVTG